MPYGAVTRPRTRCSPPRSAGLRSRRSRRHRAVRWAPAGSRSSGRSGGRRERRHCCGRRGSGCRARCWYGSGGREVRVRAGCPRSGQGYGPEAAQGYRNPSPRFPPRRPRQPPPDRWDRPDPRSRRARDGRPSAPPRRPTPRRPPHRRRPWRCWTPWTRRRSRTTICRRTAGPSGAAVPRQTGAPRPRRARSTRPARGRPRRARGRAPPRPYGRRPRRSPGSPPRNRPRGRGPAGDLTPEGTGRRDPYTEGPGPGCAPGPGPSPYRSRQSLTPYTPRNGSGSLLLHADCAVLVSASRSQT